MNEEQMQRLMMLASLVVTCLSGLAAVALLVMSALQFTWAALTASILLGGVTIGAGWATSYYSARVDPQVFNNAAEREVLTFKQRKALRKARGDVVMEKAMIDIQHERANIVHNLELESVDPNRPPHQTQFTPQTDWTKRLEARKPKPRAQKCEHGYVQGDCSYLDCEHY